MSCGGFCARSFRLSGTFTVTIPNDSRGDLRERPDWEGFCGAPSPPGKAAPAPPRTAQLLPAPPDSDPDASLLEPSDGEAPDSPWTLNTEEEAKLLEEDEADSFAPFAVMAKGGRSPVAPEAALPPSAAAESLRRTVTHSFPPAESGTGLTGVPGHGGRPQSGPLSSAAFPEAVPSQAGSVGPEKAVEAEPPSAGRGPSAAAESATPKRSTRLAGKRAAPLSEEEEAEYAPTAHLRRRTAAAQCVGRPKSHTPFRQQQIHIRQADLEGSLQSYINTVLNHLHHIPFLGPVNELDALMQRVSSERHSQGDAFRHPADLTMRNYAERTNRPAQRCTLSQWVAQNQPDRPLFADIPERFERSPFPGL